MKENIHPKYYPDAKVTCSCGRVFTVGSTLPELRTELCSACHPFYTGQEKLVDTERRVEKFEKKMAKAKAGGAGQPKKKSGDKSGKDSPNQTPRTLRDMLKQAKESSS